MIFGGIEAGGTKFVCAVGSGPDDLREEIRFPTTTPEETISRAINYFQEQEQKVGPLAGIGISAFGPVDPNPASPTFGFITSTPKPGWQNADFAGRIKSALPRPVGFDTDVNGAALGEWRWGAAQGLDTFLYITIGTGIGGGGMAQGRLLHGLIHPEMGHMLLRRDPQRDPFPGRCPFHGDCWEGLASGPAIEDRWQKSAKQLPPEHPAWELEADYIAQAVHNLICVFSPQRIILGGGVMKQPQLFPLVWEKVPASLRGYVQHGDILEKINTYLVPPGLGDKAGVLGAIALAEQAANGIS